MSENEDQELEETQSFSPKGSKDDETHSLIGEEDTKTFLGDGKSGEQSIDLAETGHWEQETADFDSSQHGDESTLAKSEDFERTRGTGAGKSGASFRRIDDRYQINKKLGVGGFGVVYRATDLKLKREVALKIPHPHRLDNEETVSEQLIEAQVVAQLDHPNIVPVYDVKSVSDCPILIVSKLVEGSSLRELIGHRTWEHKDAASLVKKLAEALDFAHKKGVVHRDVKPGNILIDEDGVPFLVDFGLAIREHEVQTQGKEISNAGTPAYMSPEQARGEAHRVDNRSDIFSLGIVLFELLVGRRPFQGESLHALMKKIAESDAKSPREIDGSIPIEIERICLKALARRPSDRYATARELAEDLGAAWIKPTTPSTTSPASETRVLELVPKGLKSYDDMDASFFLRLLPGSKDRAGVPESIRFWKKTLENPSVSCPPVSLIYGPSGCGKSSFVKAGLIPSLSAAVKPIYIEATGKNTESRLLAGLRRAEKTIARQATLPEAIAAIRRKKDSKERIVVFIDQFEQWLNEHRETESTELLHALRQCDGERVACVAMVRDDFWMSTSRFFGELEISLVEGGNSAAIDLFPLSHARNVLTAYGGALGALPSDPAAMSKSQSDFIAKAVDELAVDGKVVCLRLALFSEMMKDQTWDFRTLRALGGTEGIGATFLDNTLSSQYCAPHRRVHQEGTRATLKALLPAQRYEH